MSGGLLALWSVPRARSTAFLRMMAERGDHTVVHEPFSRLGAFRSITVGGRTCRDATHVMRALEELATERPVFFKETTDYRYPEVYADRRYLRAVTHCYLVRRPEAVVASYLGMHPVAGRGAMGFEHLAEVDAVVRAATGQVGCVVDGDRLVADPRRTVAAFCDRVGIPFEEEALTWQPGALPDWSQFSDWHEQVAETSGFVATRAEPVPDDLRELAASYVAHHRPFYDRLVARRRALSPRPRPRARRARRR